MVKIVRRRFGRGFVLAAVGAALLTGLALAGGGGDATIEATQFSVDHTFTGVEVAECPAGKRALGGGVVQSGQAAGLNVRASGPLDASGDALNTKDGDTAKQWYAAVRNFSGADDRVFKVFAICSAASKARIEATKFTLDNGESGDEFAKCPAGKRALGGGVVQSGSSAGLFVRASGPLDASGDALDTKDGDKATQWYAAVVNFSGADDRVFKVFAICAADTKARIEATKLTVDDAQTDQEYVKCGQGKRALGGGIVQSGTADNFSVQTSGPLDASGETLNTIDGDRAKQWYAGVENNSGDDDRVFKVFAICE